MNPKSFPLLSQISPEKLKELIDKNSSKDYLENSRLEQIKNCVEQIYRNTGFTEKAYFYLSEENHKPTIRGRHAARLQKTKPFKPNGIDRMKLKFIDSTRGIAILMVILVHTSQKIDSLDFLTSVIASYGQMGVQLFFIASAYTLCLSSFKRDKENLPLVKFGIRRYFRIAPAYYLALLGYLFISLILSKLQSGEFILAEKYTFKNILSNIFFIHGFYPPANNNIVPGGWSIGTEIAFYSIFPALIYIAKVTLTTSRKKIFAFVFFGILFSQLMLMLLVFIGYNISNNNFIYFNIINQLPVFLIGIGYFFLSKRSGFLLNWKLNFIFFILFSLLSVLPGYSGVDYYFSFIPTISGISFVFLIELIKKFNFLNPKILIRIGQVSFSMYLIHFIFAQLITGFLASKFIVLNGTVSLLVFYLLSVFLTFGFALLSEKFIEKPSIEFGKKLIRKIDIIVPTSAIVDRRHG